MPDSHLEGPGSFPCTHETLEHLALSFRFALSGYWEYQQADCNEHSGVLGCDTALNPKDRGNVFPRNIGNRPKDYTVSQHRRPHS
jgi:hypothetical protein